MELEKKLQRGRQRIELYAHTPDPCDAFTDSRYPMSVTYRCTLDKEQWKSATLGNLNDFIPELPFKCKLDKVNIHVETFIGNHRKWLVVIYLCSTEKLGKKVYKSLEETLV